MTNVRLGFESGSGAPVEIPVRHMVVTGQTQEAGKTTTLEALIERSGRTAITFVTKRGEGSFQSARRIRPYFRERADWQFVASILEASRGEKLKFERSWIIKAARGAKTLADVHRNVKKALETAKGINEGVYTVLDAYLEVVVPEIARVQWAHRIDLGAGVNAMDLTGLSGELQHLVIRSALEWVHDFEQNTIVVIPEAWKFIPQGRGTPVKLAAEAFIRESAGLKNYLWLDSQDIGGVEKTFLRGCPVWLLGVQREANEIKRTLENIPEGIAKPKKSDLATLELGFFYACWGKHATKTYVQPAWMEGTEATMIATSGSIATYNNGPRRPKLEEPTVKESEARELLATNERLERENADLRRRIDALESKAPSSNDRPETRTPVRTPEKGDTGSTPVGAIADEDELYLRFKARLVKESPAIIRVLATKQEINVEVERRIITMDGSSMPGRLARLIAARFFREIKRHTDVRKELDRTGPTVHGGDLSKKLVALVKDGFLTDEGEGYREVEGMLVNVMER